MKPSENNPLVSVLIATFNSSEFILETLESLKKQTYTQFEIIICDDSSTDNTAKICENWILKNKKHVQCKLLINPKNGGITKNLNNGLVASQGRWIKILGGDDLLSANALQNYINFAVENTGVKVFCSKFMLFDNFFTEDRLYEPPYIGYHSFYSEVSTPKMQFKKLLRRNFVHGPTLFIERSLLSFIGGFNERYPFEDLPLGIALTRAGVKIHFLNKVTVYYRLHQSSITGTKGKIFSSFYKHLHKFNKEVIFKDANAFIKICKAYDYYRNSVFDSLGLNKNTRFCRALYKSTTLLNPLYLYNYFF